MFRIKSVFLAIAFALTGAAQVQATESMESLAAACVDALKKNDKAAFDALFISPEELVRSIQEDAYKDNPTERKRMLDTFSKDGKGKLLGELANAKANTWPQLRPSGLNWSTASIVNVEPSYNREDGVEKTDWSRITVTADGQIFLLNLHQSRLTPQGWRLVFGGKLKGPLRLPAPDAE